MATPGNKPKRGEVLRVWIDFIFGFENKKGEVLDHWIAFFDTLNFPPQDFYAAIEKELQARKVPGMEISREEFSEGGLVSDQRIYLRLLRERLFIYTCAAPFGTGYFLSCRVVHVPALVRLWHIIAALVFFGGVGLLLIKPLGFIFTIIAVVALLFALAGVMRNAAVSAFADVDALLLKIPAVSTVYQDWFRSETYWREDTRAIYLQRIPEVIRKVAGEITAEKGAKLVQQFRYAPIFGELYKPMLPKAQPT
ncbi:MAG TPA: hypothetical protein VMJ12_09605 [Candidatus Acidoferrales bacterium]|nr:hypothetical protein [Candidatus Acidoferrales bacterium]